MLNSVFDRFAEQSPISVMARGMIERILNPAQLNEWFENTAQEQYTRELLFSSVFDIMELFAAFIPLYMQLIKLLKKKLVYRSLPYIIVIGQVKSKQNHDARVTP